MATLDHHNPEYKDIEASYNGMDYNDYLFELALQAIDNSKK